MRLEAITSPDALSRNNLDIQLRKLDPLFHFLDEVPRAEQALVRVSDGSGLMLWNGSKQQVVDYFLRTGKVALIYDGVLAGPGYHPAP